MLRKGNCRIVCHYLNNGNLVHYIDHDVTPSEYLGIHFVLNTEHRILTGVFVSRGKILVE